jgi:hypothetical protein
MAGTPVTSALRSPSKSPRGQLLLTSQVNDRLVDSVALETVAVTE